MAWQRLIPKDLAHFLGGFAGATISAVALRAVKTEIGVLVGYLIQHSCFPLASLEEAYDMAFTAPG